eukprot:GEMP01027515.1.p1 GENE.GEMP01027515.1~~GEMP01027515.1.p1  ORF type:complete len:401 (+),score=70.73 GEMP01027515.1:285-1487(+)
MVYHELPNVYESRRGKDARRIATESQTAKDLCVDLLAPRKSNLPFHAADYLLKDVVGAEEVVPRMMMNHGIRHNLHEVIYYDDNASYAEGDPRPSWFDDAISETNPYVYGRLPKSRFLNGEHRLPTDPISGARSLSKRNGNCDSRCGDATTFSRSSYYGGESQIADSHGSSKYDKSSSRYGSRGQGEDAAHSSASKTGTDGLLPAMGEKKARCADPHHVNGGKTFPRPDERHPYALLHQHNNTNAEFELNQPFTTMDKNNRAINEPKHRLVSPRPATADMVRPMLETKEYMNRDVNMDTSSSSFVWKTPEQVQKEKSPQRGQKSKDIKTRPETATRYPAKKTQPDGSYTSSDRRAHEVMEQYYERPGKMLVVPSGQNRRMISGANRTTAKSYATPIQHRQ